MKLKIILVPRLYHSGGIANYYSVLQNYLNEEYIYLYRGKDKKNNKFKRFISDYLKFFKTIRKFDNKKVVIINSSFGAGSIYRDGLYSLLTPKYIKTIVFFRGWDSKFEEIIEKKLFLGWWLKNTFLKADKILVLSSVFKEKLISWGYENPIKVETTLVDDKMVKGINIKNKNFKEKHILFLSRIEREKGVFETVDAFKQLSRNFTKLKLTLAGDGSSFDALKSYLQNTKRLNISLPGYVRGEKKRNCFRSATLFVFPSVHGEGMPNSVLEAMAFGLPILTTSVGGIPDFFEEGKMGFFLKNRDPAHISERIEYLLDRPELMSEISEYNYNYAKEHFYASKVATRLEKIIDDLE